MIDHQRKSIRAYLRGEIEALRQRPQMIDATDRSSPSRTHSPFDTTCPVNVQKPDPAVDQAQQLEPGESQS